jgi:type IV fimbrial biogenesis protein FimT
MLAMVQRGVTLIELMVGIAILALLLGLGVPSFSLWLQNSQVRSAAESILNGLQLARAEAVSRNTEVRFQLTDADGLVAWKVGCVTVTDDCPATIQSRSSAEGGANARAGVTTDATMATQYATVLTAATGLPAGVTFDGLGRIPAANVGSDITRVDVTNAATVDARRLVIAFGIGNQIRMCDPALTFATNPQGC